MKWKIRNMVLLLSVIPALLLALIIQLLAFSEQQAFGERNIEETRQTLIKTRQNELVHYLDIAYSTIKPLYDGEDAMSPAVQEEAKRRLRALRYGKDGYYFGYNDRGDRIFLAGKDEGKNFWDLKDSQGTYLTRELIAAAKRGGDFLTYYFPKPGNDSTPYPKLSYSIYLEKWNWTVGAGFYIDGVDALIDEQMPIIIVAPRGDMYEKLVSNVQEVKARKGRVLSITGMDEKEIKALSDAVIEIPDTLDCLSPLLTTVPLQLLSYHVAVLRGCNVDQPRNLAKSVTVE